MRRKRLFQWWCVLLTATMVIAGPVACDTGGKARDGAAQTGGPIDLVDAGVEEDVRKGIALIAQEDPTFDDALAQLNADAFFLATSSGSRWRIASTAMPHWPTVRGYAERGFTIEIARGTMGVNVAASLTVRLDEFERVLNQVSQGASPE